MKALIKSILVVAVMLGTYTSFANEPLEFAATFKFINKGNAISVTNASGEIIYSGTINYNGNLIRLFDFSKLKNGIYTVEISKAFEIEVIDLEVKNKNVRLLAETQEKIFKPVFRAEENTVIISKIALDSKEMHVEIYYQDELIFKENIDDEEDILNRVYKLDTKNQGNYTAIIRTNNRVYTEHFSI